ncbi:NnrT protein [Palleronia sp.]|uniref:NnrT protein n=1 Tax=Palleronia sp. TaxID=1940284 RepID=UPI0035C82CC1
MRSGWSTRRLTVALYPFGAGAAAVNVFFLSLILSWIGLSVLTPVQSVLSGCIIGIPASWAFARHLRSLMDGVDAA